MGDLGARPERVERALVRPPDERRARERPHERLVRIERDRDPVAVSRRPYSASGWTAAATFAGSVHGVVVQTTSASPVASRERKRTWSDGSTRSS